MATEPNTAPKSDLVAGIESNLSTSPAEGSGLYHSLNDLSNEHIFPGRVDEIFMGNFCAVVSLYGLQSRLPCIWSSSVANRFFGAQEVNAPTIGTEVRVYVPTDKKFGIILGIYGSPAGNTGIDPVGMISIEGGVNSFSTGNAHNPSDWGLADYLINVADGMPVDAMPGDWGITNENNSFLGILRLLGIIRGSDLAKLELFSLDDLVRLTSHNWQHFTALGEERITDDWGTLDKEETASIYTYEGLGEVQSGNDIQTINPDVTLRSNPDQSSIRPTNDIDAKGVGPLGKNAQADLAIGRWRWKRFLGYMGNIVQEFVVRPGKNIGSLFSTRQSPPINPDMGMYEHSVDTSGYAITRSVVGAGLHKPFQIAVPQKAYEADDPAGNSTQPQSNPKVDFTFQGNPAAVAAQLRDYFAWYCNNYQHQSRLEKNTDWVVPDEADCPAPGTSPTPQGLGTWFLPSNPLQQVMAGSQTQLDETKKEGINFRVGEAWCHILPDGSFSMKSSCNCGIEARAGHLTITAPKGVTILSGGDIINLAGDDYIIKANQAIDISSTLNQVRIKGEKDLFFHTEKAGMLFTAPTLGYEFNKGPGEQTEIPGIVFDTKSGMSFIADSAVFNLSEQFYITGQKDEEYPFFYTKTQGEYHWVEYGDVAWETHKGFAMMSDGNYFSTGRLQVEGDCFIKGQCLFSTGTLGNEGPVIWDKIPPLSIQEDIIFKASDWEAFQYPLNLSDIPNVEFSFRSSSECGTGDMQMFETNWQRELDPYLTAWKENSISKNQTYPWPGTDTYNGNSFFTYKEANVNPNGLPKSRTAQTAKGGKLTPNPFSALKIAPRTS